MRAALRQVREARGLTQAQVAALAGIDRVSFLHIESGRRNPSLAVALRIATVLAADPRDLFADLARDPESAPAAGE